ncbi:Uncharacterised protein [Vibrio cholerae]|nr:Uncharacterised protein [Vibrio cholerae]
MRQILVGRNLGKILIQIVWHRTAIHPTHFQLHRDVVSVVNDFTVKHWASHHYTELDGDSFIGA